MSNLQFDPNGCFVLKGDYLNLDDCEYKGKTIYPRTKAGCIEGFDLAILDAISGLQKIINILSGQGVFVAYNEYSDRIDYIINANIGKGLKFVNGKIELDLGDDFWFDGNLLAYNPPQTSLTGYKID